MRVTPSFPSARRWRLGLALGAMVIVASCSKSNQAGNSDAGDDDGGSDSAIDTSLGDDVVIGDDVFIGDDSSPANCTIPDGLYTVTQTPQGDAGDLDEGGPPCTAMTSTVVYPLGSGGDGGTSCTLTPDGMTPSCTIDFYCTQTGATTDSVIQGYIQVFQTSYEGFETVTVTSNAVGLQQLSQCNYTLSFAPLDGGAGQ
jgi:hypothetical protein